MSRDVSSVWHEFIVIEESVCETVSVRIAETAALAYLTVSTQVEVYTFNIYKVQVTYTLGHGSKARWSKFARRQDKPSPS